jgi:hypothetical protein
VVALLNRTFREFAEFYSVAVIPHAPRSPRGKASVESSVGKIANRIRNMLRDRVFFDFDELNEAIAEKLAELNSRAFQKKAGSRDERFEGAEREALQPLPARPFEIARWGSPVKVPKSYHVLLAQDGVCYSVPHRLVNRYVEVRWTATKVEVFCEGERAAIHVRDKTKSRGESVTDPAHRPRSHADFLDHDSGKGKASTRCAPVRHKIDPSGFTEPAFRLSRSGLPCPRSRFARIPRGCNCACRHCARCKRSAARV